jgi:hypothetical protein
VQKRRPSPLISYFTTDSTDVAIDGKSRSCGRLSVFILKKPWPVRLAVWRLGQPYSALVPSGTRASGTASTGVIPSA